MDEALMYLATGQFSSLQLNGEVLRCFRGALMASAIDVGGDIGASATALAGLLLVFLGFAVTSFEGYSKQEQGAVRPRYQRRAWLAFAGFGVSVLAAIFGILGKWLQVNCLAVTGVALFLLAIGVALAAGLMSALDVR
jgi:hypothetical protein